MATRTTQAKRSRGLKQTRAVEQKPNSRLDTRYVVYGLGALLGIALLVFLVDRFGGKVPGEKVADLGNLHVQAGQPHIPYNSTPPTSGPHLGNIAPWGEHTDPIVDELQVHNLEDGGVIVQYNCPEDCPELVEQLRGAIGQAFGGNYEEAERRAQLSFADPQAAHWILAPYPDMESRIAVTAWTRIYEMDEVDEEGIATFLRLYEGLDHHVSGVQ